MVIAYCNGSFLQLNKPYFSESESGVFTTILIEDARIYFLEEHLIRLQEHAKKLNILINPISEKVLFQLIEKNKAIKGKWRIRIIITTKIVLATIQKEKSSQVEKISLNLFQMPFVSAEAKLKTLANFKRLELLEYANKKGFNDCITFDENQNILETSIANIFWIKDSSFYYPDPKLPYLQGITLSFAIKVAKKINLNIQSGKYKLNHLEDAEVFYCNSMKKILPVIQIENIKKLKESKRQLEFIRHFHEVAKAHSTYFVLKTQQF